MKMFVIIHTSVIFCLTLAYVLLFHVFLKIPFTLFISSFSAYKLSSFQNLFQAFYIGGTATHGHVFSCFSSVIFYADDLLFHANDTCSHDRVASIFSMVEVLKIQTLKSNTKILISERNLIL